MMERALVHRKEYRSKYRITLPGVAIILVVFATVLPYAIPSGDPAYFVLATIGLTGVTMGMLAGIPRIDLRVDMDSVMFGLLGTAVIGISSMFVSFSYMSVAGVLVFAAVCEELGFRFGVQRLAERVMGSFVALVFQAGLFMLYHWVVYPGYEVVAAYPLVAGLVLGAVYMWTKDLTAPLIAHVIVNSLVALTSS